MPTACRSCTSSTSPRCHTRSTYCPPRDCCRKDRSWRWGYCRLCPARRNFVCSNPSNGSPNRFVRRRLYPTGCRRRAVHRRLRHCLCCCRRPTRSALGCSDHSSHRRDLQTTLLRTRTFGWPSHHTCPRANPCLGARRWCRARPRRHCPGKTTRRWMDCLLRLTRPGGRRRRTVHRKRWRHHWPIRPADPPCPHKCCPRRTSLGKKPARDRNAGTRYRDLQNCNLLRPSSPRPEEGH